MFIAEDEGMIQQPLLVTFEDSFRANFGGARPFTSGKGPVPTCHSTLHKFGRYFFLISIFIALFFAHLKSECDLKKDLKVLHASKGCIF
jgi:hypothetical protein